MKREDSAAFGAHEMEHSRELVKALQADMTRIIVRHARKKHLLLARSKPSGQGEAKLHKPLSHNYALVCMRKRAIVRSVLGKLLWREYQRLRPKPSARD